MTDLRRRRIDELTIGHYSLKTIPTYVAPVARLAKHFNRSPDRLTPEEIRPFQLHLIDRRVTWSPFKQIACAMRFFYGRVLRPPEVVERIPYAKRPRMLADILSPEEVKVLLDSFEPSRNRMLFGTIDAAGLRLGEGLRLRAKDIDAKRMTIAVRQGKGGKDRYVPLSPRLLEELRDYWRSCRKPVSGTSALVCVGATLREVAANPKRLGAVVGLRLMLHTWGQTLTHHPHVHVIVTGGGRSCNALGKVDASPKWVSCRPGFFRPVRVLSAVFRGKYVAALKRLHAEKALVFTGVLQKVTFKDKDYRDNRAKTMTLEGVEFLRRFVQHVLPKGFVKIRHQGLLANRCREDDLTVARRLLFVAGASIPANRLAGEEPPIEPARPRSCPKYGSPRGVCIRTPLAAEVPNGTAIDTTSGGVRR